MIPSRFHLPLLLLALAGCGGADRHADRAPRDTVAVHDTTPTQGVAVARDEPPGCPAPPGWIAMQITKGPPHRFRLFESPVEGTEMTRVDSIQVVQGCGHTQTLRPDDNQLSRDYGEPRLSRVDLDFDGFGDLAFVSMTGAGANTAMEYWRYDPFRGRFDALGGFEMLQVDSVRHVLTNYNQCCGGMQWVAGTYRVENGKMVTLRQVEQSQPTALEAANRYVYTVRERRGDSLAIVRSDTIGEPEAQRRTLDGEP